MRAARRVCVVCVVAVAAALALAPAPRPAAAGPPAAPPPAAPAVHRYLVTLDGPPLVAFRGARRRGLPPVPRDARGRLRLDSAPARAYLAHLDAARAATVAALAQALPRTRLEREYRVLANGFVVAATDRDADALGRLPHVARVERADRRRYRPTLDASLPLIQAPALWSRTPLGADSAGDGIKVAVIDTGIDVHHPFFDPAGYQYPAGYPRGAVDFTTPKVIAARAYFRPDDPVDPSSDEPNPSDHLGHGSHVAGIIAGNHGTVADVHGTAVTVSGVAPRAQLMSYKVFYRAMSGQEDAADPELMAAFEDAVLDGADVISNSWGGPDLLGAEVPPDSPYALAVAAGCVVVFAAGNDGPGAGTVSWPGSGERFITVGATGTGRRFSRILEVTGPAPVPAGFDAIPMVPAFVAPDVTESLSAPVRSGGAVDGGANLEGCEAFSAGVFQDALALVRRGTCTFSTKIEHAAQAGAVAVVVYNNEAGPPFPMTGDAVSVPAVMIDRDAGEAVAAFAAAHADATATLHAEPIAVVEAQEVDRVASFSSVGPTPTPALKPDVAAPGYLILSASAGPVGSPGPPYALLAGTSMATPHVAGTAALLVQLHPTWGHDEVKAALVGTAARDVTGADGGPARPLEVGGGRIQLDRLARVRLAFDPPVVNLGAGRPGEVFARSVTLRRLDEAAGEVTLGWQPATGAGAPDFAPADGITLAAGETTFDVVVTTSAADPAGDYSGWLLAHTADGEEYHAPYLVRLVPARDRDLLLVDMSFAETPPTDFYEGLAQASGLRFDLAAPANGIPVPPLETLLRYRAVLVFTGDDQLHHAWPEGVQALDRLASYLHAGGRVIVTGQGPLRGSSVLAAVGLLGGQTLPDPPLRDPVTGDLVALDDYVVTPTGTPLLATAPLHLDPAGPGDLTLVGEATLALAEADIDLGYSRRAFFLDAGTPGAAAGVLFDPFRAYGHDSTAEKLTHRAVLLEFGLESLVDPAPGTAGPGSPLEVLERSFRWVTEEVTLEVTATLDDRTLTLTADATSANGAPAGYEFDFGDGSPVLETTEAAATHTYARYGTNPVEVVARSDLEGAAVWRRDLYVAPDAPDGGIPPDGAAAGDASGAGGVAPGCGGCRAGGARGPGGILAALAAFVALSRSRWARRSRPRRRRWFGRCSAAPRTSTRRCP